MTQERATGSIQDNQKRSYVKSPTRTDDTAQEVYLKSVELSSAQIVELLTLQKELLNELKIMNLHLQTITGEDLCL